MMTALLELFNHTFDRSTLMAWAREERAVRRMRLVHPQDFCGALLSSALGDETRSIATVRRLFMRLTATTPEESSFYQRFTPALLRLLRRIFKDLLSSATSVVHGELAAVLTMAGLSDLMATDATQIALPAAARDNMPSTQRARGGIKLTTTLSVLRGQLERIGVTNARVHDRKALRLPRWLHGVLYLVDLGYWDYKLFDSIARRGGRFITPLKKSARPRIACIRSGLGGKHEGATLRPDLPFRGTVDLDAEFRFAGGVRTLRVVRVWVDHRGRDGRVRRLAVWLVTNLDDEVLTPQQVATLYRLRWEVEVLFRTLKTVARLDQIQSANVVVVQSFVLAALIAYMLAQQICSTMRKQRPQVEPSIYRVMCLLLGHLPEILLADDRDARVAVCAKFENALWREGVNPNPGRPYARTKYAVEMGHCA